MRGASTTRLHVVGLRSKLLRDEPEGLGLPPHSWPQLLQRYSGVLIFLLQALAPHSGQRIGYLNHRIQISMLSLVFPKRNPTAHGNGLPSYSANAVATTFPDRKKKDHRHTPIPITGVSRSGQHVVIRARPDRWYWRKSLVQRKSDKRSRERFPVINSGRLMLPLRLSGLTAFVEV